VKESTDQRGNILGTFRATGAVPKFLASLKPYGVELPDAHFDPAHAL